jgi:predicted PurR-regulated permease PerM
VVVALILSPLVRLVRRAHVPRGLAVLLVFLGFAAVIAGGVFLAIGPIRTQVESFRENLPSYTDQAQRQVVKVQRFFDDRGVDVNVQERLDSAISAIRDKGSEAADNILSYSLDVLSFLVTLIIIIVCTVYMLLDAPRIVAFAQRIGGPGAGAYLRRTERNLTQYVKAQLLVCLIIGVSSGIVLWIYGVTGLFPAGAEYAVAFAAWVFFMEFIPYIGPILGAIPPVVLALFESPFIALWVVVAFVAIHQLEGHVVVPQVMGEALGVHPLVVIFGLLVGEQLYGLVGILLSIPVVVILKETLIYGAERLQLAGWQRDEAEMAVSAAPRPPPTPPEPAPAPPEAEREAPTESLGEMPTTGFRSER